MLFVESGGLFDEETFVTAEKVRVYTGNICNRQDEKGFNVKRLKPFFKKLGDVKHLSPSRKKRF